jgi:dsRNA-specific ribonuclease
MPFNGHALSKFAKEWNFVVTTSSPHYAQSNGQAKCIVQIVTKVFKKVANSNNDWFTAELHNRNTLIADGSGSSCSTVTQLTATQQMARDAFIANV